MPTREPFAGRLYAKLDRYWWFAFIVLLGVSVFFGFGVGNLKFDNSYRIWFIESDPDLVAYDRFIEQFDSDEALAITLTTARGTVLDPEPLRTLAELSSEFGGYQGVIRVWSLTHIDHFIDADGGLEIVPLVRHVPLEAQERKRVEGLLDSSPLYGRLVSPDRKTSAILMTLDRTEDSFTPKAQLLRRVQARLADLPPTIVAHVGGAPAIDEALYRYTDEDARRFVPLMIVVLLSLLALFFGRALNFTKAREQGRSPAAEIGITLASNAIVVALPVVVVLISALWTFGLIAWLGWKANLITSILPSLVMAIGIADSIHLLHGFRLYRQQGASRRRAARFAFSNLFRPCLVTTVTTGAGLASLYFAKLEPVREFGLIGCFGVMSAYLISMIAVPLSLARLPGSLLGGLNRSTPRPVARILAPIANLGRQHSKAVVWTTLVLLGVGIVGITRIEVGANMTSYFQEQDPVLVEAREIDRALGGSFPLEVLVSAPDGQDLLEPEALAAMQRVSDAVRDMDGTGTPVSFLDMMREAKRSLWGDEPGADELPASRAEAAQVLLLMEDERDLKRYLSHNRELARISVPSSMDHWEILTEDLPTIDRAIQDAGGEHLEARVAGLGRLLVNMERYLVDSQIRTFGVAFVLVLGLIGVLFGSFRIGVVSALPNLPPLILVLGVMGWVGIRLDPGTVMIAPILLGLVVDDTVHLIERVNQARKRGDDVVESLRHGILRAGPALVLTSVILSAGFLTTVTGSFKPNIYFGALSSLAILFALTADLVFLPAVSRLVPQLWQGKNEEGAVEGARGPQ